MSGREPWTDDRYQIETPERIDLGYDIAGLGSRFLAALIDSILLAVVAIAVFYLGTWGLATLTGGLAGLLEGLGLRFDSETSVETLALASLAASLLLSFGVFWGYYIFFELIWQGQSPGKRVVGLRVIKEGGYPIGFVDSAIRNVVRLVDFLPGYYVIGMIIMFIDGRARRLGDLAAGTLVIKERKELKLDALGFDRPSLPVSTDATAPSLPTLPNLGRLTPSDRSLLREYFLRRPSLEPTAAITLAGRLADAFAHKLEHHRGDEPAEEFLARLERELRERAR